MSKKRETETARKLDTRRKILLGAFLMAQAKHRPKEFEWVGQELSKFLDTHENKQIAELNKEALADWIKNDYA